MHGRMKPRLIDRITNMHISQYVSEIALDPEQSINSSLLRKTHKEVDRIHWNAKEAH